MFDSAKWIRAARTVPSGKMKMQVWKEAIREADEAGDYKQRIYFRKEYLHEAVFYDDCMMMYVIFPEELKIFDEYHGEKDADLTYDVMWNYKWLLGIAQDFYQISIEQFEVLSADFKQRCLKYGYSLRAYYEYLVIFYMNIDEEKAALAYENFLRCSRDELSDCGACERDTEAYYHMVAGNKEQVMPLVQDLLSRKLSCLEIPDTTYGRLMMFHLLLGNREEAGYYCSMILNTIRRKKLDTGFIGSIILYYSLTDLPEALGLFKKYYGWELECRNPNYKFNFAVGAALLWKKLKDSGKDRLHIKLAKEFPLYQEDDWYEVKSLADYYRTMAQDLADKFDSRNQTPYYGNLLNDVLEKEIVQRLV